MIKKSNVIILTFILLAIALLLLFSSGSDTGETGIEQKLNQTLTIEELNGHLPLSKTVYEGDTDTEIIAYRLFFDLIDIFKKEGKVENGSFTRFYQMNGDDNEFDVAVVFNLYLSEYVKDSDWGKIENRGFAEDLVWKLHIKKIGNETYSLESIEKLTDKMIGLPPVQDLGEFKQEIGVTETNEEYQYQIIDKKLEVTYNNGEDWLSVPVEIEQLFEGDYNGATNYLIEGSYVISPERTAFVIGGHQDFHLLISTDQGKSWDTVLITDSIEGARMRLLGFTSEQDGYFITTGFRTMSSEGNFVFKTNDGGKTWNQVSGPGTSSMLTDGGFINNELGFISFGSLNYMDEPPQPLLYRTDDAGDSWYKVDIPIPEKYKGIFTVAEIPIFKGNKGFLLVNQGSTGDYLGGKVLAKYTSNDMGVTWEFAGLVDPDRVLLD